MSILKVFNTLYIEIKLFLFIIARFSSSRVLLLISDSYGHGFFWLSNFCDDEIVKNNKNEQLWSSNSQKDVIFLQEV